MSTPVVAARDLRVHFPTRDGLATVKAVDGVDFDVMPGEIFGVIGESGCGKTTLGRALVALIPPTGGVILQNGVDARALSATSFREHRRGFQIVFQDPHGSLNPRRAILDSVAEPLAILKAMPKAQRLHAAREMLERVGLAPEIGSRFPHQLSGGQKQRVNIARVLTLRPKLIVCDEVVAALDVSIRGDILNLFTDLRRDFNLTYVFITHDIGVVSHISDRVAVMYLGRLMELGPTDGVIDRPLHPYTQALLSAEPRPLPTHLRPPRRILLHGEIPSPVAPPSGCRFRTRCPAAKPRCAQETPEWRELTRGHFVACHFATSAGPPTPSANDITGGNHV